MPIFPPLFISACFCIYPHVYWTPVGHRPVTALGGGNGTHDQRRVFGQPHGTRAFTISRKTSLPPTRTGTAPRLQKTARPKGQACCVGQVGMAALRRGTGVCGGDNRHSRRL